MSESVTFPSALQTAIARRNRVRLLYVGLVLVPILLVEGLLASIHAPLMVLGRTAIPGLIGVAVVWFADPGMRVLRRLRKSEPDVWVASPSHGLLVVDGESMIVGGVGALAFDKHATRRCEGVGYLEDQHAFAIQALTASTRSEDNQRRTTYRVKLDRELPAEQALKLALRLNALAAR